MDIQNVEIAGLKTLYDGVYELYMSSSSHKVFFEKKIENLLSNVKILLTLRNVNSFELLFMHLYTSKIFGIKKIFNKEKSKSNINTFKEIKKELEIYNSYIDSYNTNYIDRLYKPLSLSLSDCKIMLTGSKLLRMFSNDILSTFIQMTDGKCIIKENNEDLMVKDFDFNSINLNHIFINKFISSFYNFINEKINYLDLGSDFVLNEFYTNGINKNSYKVFSIFSENINLDFINDSKKVIDIKTHNFRALNLSHDESIENTFVSIGFNTSIIIMIEILNSIKDYDYTLYIEPFRTIVSNSFNDELMKNEFNNKSILDLINSVNNNYYTNEFIFHRVSNIFGFVNAKFIINISLSDLSKVYYKCENYKNNLSNEFKLIEVDELSKLLSSLMLNINSWLFKS